MARKAPSNTNGGEQIELLRGIWNEMKAVKSSLERELAATRDDLGGRIDQTNARREDVRVDLKAENATLHSRLVESGMRVATAVTGLAGDMRSLSELIREWHRADRAELRQRVVRIEQHVGLAQKA